MIKNTAETVAYTTPKDKVFFQFFNIFFNIFDIYIRASLFHDYIENSGGYKFMYPPECYFTTST